MNERIEGIKRLTRLVIRAAMDDQVTFLAASIAFYAFISIFPLLLLALVIGSVLGGEAFATLLLGFVRDLLTPEAEALIEEALLAGGGRGSISAISVVFLLWSGLKVFRGLDIAFSRVYGEGAPDPGFLEGLVHAVMVLSAVGVGFLAMFLVGTGIRFIVLPPVVTLLSPLLLFLTIAVLFYPLYFVFPGVRQSPRAVVPGTLIAATGWTILAEVFGIYAANAGTYALFGLIGGVMLLMMLFYFGAIVLLLGAIVNAVLAGRYREMGVSSRPPDDQDEEKPIGGGYDAHSTPDE